ncbi:MAG: hypothetical protein K2P78_10325, partial [Gemmataceae bacterium]|nr:hypothetical protein [Gemmataceae bacterium]
MASGLASRRASASSSADAAGSSPVAGVGRQPVDRPEQPAGEQLDVEPQVPGQRLGDLFPLGQQVDEQGAEPGRPQARGHGPVPRA